MERRYNWVAKYKELEYKYYKLAQSVQPKPDEPTGAELYIENIGDEAGMFSVKRNGNPTYTPNLEVKVGNSNWITYNIVEGGTTEVSVPKGSKIYLRGNNPSGFNGGNGNDDNYQLSFTQTYNVGGYITSLLTTDGFETFELSEEAKDISHTFARLFFYEGNLQDASALVMSLEYLTPHCYSGTFFGSGLKKAPELPSNHLNESCYYNLFYECTALEEVHDLPANVVPSNAYAFMFPSCHSLKQAPKIHATEIQDHGCHAMFLSCQSMVSSPDLEATQLGSNALESMFQDCYSLVQAPALPATELAVSCYLQTFYSCSALQTAPKLPATTLVHDCYGCMFTYTSVNSVEVMFDEYLESALSLWLEGAAQNGRIVKKYGVDIPTGTSGIPEGWTVEYVPEPFYIENIDSEPGYFCVKVDDRKPNLHYKIDNGEWVEYDKTSLPRIEVSGGSKIYLKGNNPYGLGRKYDTHCIFKFYSDETTTSLYRNCNIGGFITSLMVEEEYKSISNIPDYAFRYLFSGDSIVSAEKLITSNITSVGDCSFEWCFDSCASLVTAPKFDKITSVGEYGFHYCFYKCTSLVTAPTFENVTSGGYRSFYACFYICTSLVTAPTFENVTSVGNDCFEVCFYNCSSLTTSPRFDKVTDIGDRGFSACFRDSTAITTIYAPSPSTWDDSKFTNWVLNVPATGTFYKKAGLTIPSGPSGIPEGWTVVEV